MSHLMSRYPQVDLISHTLKLASINHCHESRDLESHRVAESAALQGLLYENKRVETTQKRCLKIGFFKNSPTCILRQAVQLRTKPNSKILVEIPPLLHLIQRE